MSGIVMLAGCAHTGAPAAGPALPMPFSATGTEPGWHLEMTDERLVLQAAYGTIRVEAATPPARHHGDAVEYHAHPPDHTLAVTVQDRYCTNDMSGMPHPYTVHISLDGDSFDGCGGDPATLLTGAPWRVQALAGTPVSPEPALTITFADNGDVSGHGGCNRYRGRYVLTGEGVEISGLLGTRMSCGDADALEQRFLGMLQQARHFRLQADGALVLETADSRTLTARRP